MKTLLTILAATFSLAAIAQDAQEMPKFDDVDQNKDGMISQAEATAVEGLDFAALDTNKDGAIDREEYQKHS